MTYTLRSFDGRQSLPQTFRSLAAAKREAKREFGWNRLYTSDWYPMTDRQQSGEEDYYTAIALAERPSDLAGDACYAPVIERRAS